MAVRDTFNGLVGDLEYPMFIVTAPAAEAGSAKGEFTFHRAKRVDPGHPA